MRKKIELALIKGLIAMQDRKVMLGACLLRSYTNNEHSKI